MAKFQIKPSQLGLYSACCHAQIIIAGEGETHWHQCQKCGMATDPATENCWISVKVKLPPLDTPVLVCERGVVTTIAYRCVEHYGMRDAQEIWHVLDNGGGYEHEPNECTPDYWMLLPQPANPLGGKDSRNETKPPTWTVHWTSDDQMRPYNQDFKEAHEVGNWVRMLLEKGKLAVSVMVKK